MNKLPLIMLVFCLCFYLLHGTNNSAKNAHVLKPHLYDTLYPVIYNALPTSNGEYAFRTIPAKTLKVKLMPESGEVLVRKQRSAWKPISVTI